MFEHQEDVVKEIYEIMPNTKKDYTNDYGKSYGKQSIYK